MFRRTIASERPCVEALESRMLLTSTTAAIVGADLVVTGTSGDDTITITRNAASGAYTIGGVAGTFTAMGNLRILADSGNDTVVLTSIYIGNVTTGKMANLVLEGGAGSDSLTCHNVDAASAVLTDSAGGLAAIFDIGPAADRCELTGGITFTGSADNDSLRLLAARVGKNVVCNMGDGTNFVQTTTDSGTFTVLQGSLSYTGGAGTDSVQVLDSSWIYGGLTANVGGGDNSVTFRDAMLVNGISGKLAAVSITGGAGNDTITADHLTGGGFTAKLGDGTNWTIVQKGAGAVGCNLDGALSVTGGIGDDHVRIVGSAVVGNCTVTVGDGANSLETAADGLSNPDIGGKVSYTGGLGSDTLSLAKGPIAGGIKAIVGNGVNSLSLRDTVLHSTPTGKYAALQYTGGAGSDTVTADHLESAGVTLALGGGTNAARFQKGAGTASCVIHGNVAVTGAEGGDTVALTGANIQGNATLSLGDGVNAVDTGLADAVAPRIGGKFAYTGGGGQDTLNLLGGLAITNGLTAKLGDGVNTVSFRDTTLANAGGATNVAVTGGKGPDTIYADHLSAGAFTANLGDGDNWCYLYKVLGTGRTAIAGKTAVTGGTGADTVDVRGASLAGGLTVKAGDGANGLLVQAVDGTSASLGPVAYTGGSGADTVTWTAGIVGTGAVAPAVTFTLGAGNDTFAATTNITSAFWGAVTVSAGAGADHINLGTFFGGKTRIDGGPDSDIDTLVNGHNFGLPGQPVLLNIP